jgi:Flp pilus assembly protein TadG
MTLVGNYLARLVPFTGRLARDTSGLALLEFAFAFPLILMAGLYGVETANLALIHLRVSQIALNLADNTSRVGFIQTNQIEQLREIDINDVLDAVRNQGKSLGLATNGRVTISSLENTAGVQRIHWQRCLGLKAGAGYDSSYGITSTTGLSKSAMSTYDLNAGVNTSSSGDNSASHPGTIATGGAANPTPIVGMGENNSVVAAPANGGVIFIEINYDYKPVVGGWLLGTPKIHYTASFIVRDNRDFTQIYNPSPAVATSAKMTCNRYST